MSKNYYNRKEEMKEIIKLHGGQEFFIELNAARIPFFFVAAVENTEKTTDYLCETIAPNSMGLNLTDDKFADFLDIRNHGFVAVPSADLTSESIQALKMLQETRKSAPFYGDDALMEFAKEQGIEILESGEQDDENAMNEDTPYDVSQGIIETVVRHTIGRSDIPEDGDPEQIPIPIYHCETLAITWGADGDTGHAYGDGFAILDERHQGILKGDGSFLQEKEHENVCYNLRQAQLEDGSSMEGENTDKTDEIKHTRLTTDRNMQE